MSTTQYIGARYVPVFADPAEWNDSRTYEPLTIVMHEGNSYTSRQFVPSGIDITNDKFWALTGNYNAQLEQYRQEVTAETQRATSAETQLTQDLTAETQRATAAETQLTQDLTAETQRATAAETQLQNAISETNASLSKPKTTNTMVSIALWPELSEHTLIDREVSNAKLASISKAIICVQTNELNIDDIKYCKDKLTENSIDTYAVKFHGVVNNLATIVDNVMKQLDPVKRVFVYNERYDDNFETTIKTLKSLGYTVGVSFNKESYIKAQNAGTNETPDIIGINMYPSPGYSLNPNRCNIMDAFKNQQWFQTTKTLIITETGILPYPCFYYAPELYETSKGYPFNSNTGRTKDYNVMKNYYSAAIQSLNGCCDGVCLWYWEQANEDVANFIKEIQ